jgi:hypothetical protein
VDIRILVPLIVYKDGVRLIVGEAEICGDGTIVAYTQKADVNGEFAVIPGESFTIVDGKEDLYLDTVLDERLRPMFNGTREDTQAWLQENPVAVNRSSNRVCIGESMDLLSVSEYEQLKP